MNNDFTNKINELRIKIPSACKRLPGIAKVEGLRFIADNFAKEGFENKPGIYEAWKKKTTKGARKKTLMGEKRGGSLKRSWKQDSAATGNTVEFTSALPYAEVHNEGLSAGRPPGFKMDARPMIGPSEALDKRIMDKFDKIADEIFK